MIEQVVKEKLDVSKFFLWGNLQKSYYSTLVEHDNAQKNKKNLSEEYNTILHQEHGYNTIKIVQWVTRCQKPQGAESSLIPDSFE